MTQESAPRRAKHLMDPDAPRQRSTPEDLERLAHVQRTVMSVLVATTIFHLSVGLVIGAFFIEDTERVAQVGLCVLGGLFGVLAVISAYLIHRKPINATRAATAVAVGFLPTVVGLYIVFR
ncbi:hypothetical protein [Nocardioides sp.]|uniref:hypothetical protein n=1 Tax=Nocardioides sp. TaxID=35761 RepID=UPI002B2795E6|nr:hypothetical protein [Nocardioides sp.]